MSPNSKRWLAGALIVAASIVAGWMWTNRDVMPGAPEKPAMPAQAARAAAPATLPAAPALPAELLAGAAGVPLAAHVERLLATHDPQNAYTAYLLVSACATFNDTHDLHLYDDKQHTQRGMSADERRHLTTMCGNMTERERLARFDYLAAAVKGGVPGAAWAFAVEGPFGDPSALQTRPDDPLVQEWKATAAGQLAQAADAGDELTLLLWGFDSLQGQGMVGGDPVRGYGNLLAFGLIAADRAGPNAPAALQYAEGGDVMNALGGALSQEQRAAAMAAAQRIAVKVKARRQRAEGRQGG